MNWLIATEYLWLPFSRFKTMNSCSVSKIYPPTIGSAPFTGCIGTCSAFAWFCKSKKKKQICKNK